MMLRVPTYMLELFFTNIEIRNIFAPIISISQGNVTMVNFTVLNTTFFKHRPL